MAYLPLFQNRAKRPGNKRPPSRQKLREAGSTSSPTNSDSSISPNLFVRTAQEPAKPISRLEHAITEETGIFRTKKTTVTNSAQKNSKPRKDDSNLFSSNVPSSLKGPGLKSQSQPTPSTSVFDSPPKDIFAPPPGKLTGIGESGDLFSSHQNEVKSASKKLDGILSSPSSSSKNADKSKLGRVDETDRGNKVPDIADPTSPPPDETDKKRTKRPKAKGRPDEDLFGNTDDIFSEVPNAEPKKTVKKKKKKVVSTTEEAADGEGVVKKKTVKKKKAKKPLDAQDFAVDGDNVNIFD